MFLSPLPLCRRARTRASSGVLDCRRTGDETARAGQGGAAILGSPYKQEAALYPRVQKYVSHNWHESVKYNTVYVFTLSYEPMQRRFNLVAPQPMSQSAATANLVWLGSGPVGIKGDPAPRRPRRQGPRGTQEGVAPGRIQGRGKKALQRGAHCRGGTM